MDGDRVLLNHARRSSCPILSRVVKKSALMIPDVKLRIGSKWRCFGLAGKENVSLETYAQNMLEFRMAVCVPSNH